MATFSHVETLLQSASDEGGMGCEDSRVLILRPPSNTLSVIEMSTGEEC